MKKKQPLVPQYSFLFRLVAFFSRRQLWYLIQKEGKSRLLIPVFVFVAGATALAIISILAYLTELPLLFPQLGPSAFILFYTPMSVSASPRNVIVSHVISVIAGLMFLWLFATLYPGNNLFDPAVMNGHRILVIALSMGFSCVAMVLLKCVHPPAAASALIAAMGYLVNVEQVLGIIAAVNLIVLTAIIFNRIIAGLPYPLWRADLKVARNFGEMAGITEGEPTFWRQLATKNFQRR
jgi:CBS-domain-containing membrane protein